jgi:hypothetical protein
MFSGLLLLVVASRLLSPVVLPNAISGIAEDPTSAEAISRDGDID